jgi:Tfp pilus assembly protein PilW
LVEVMIGATLGTVILAGVLSTFLMLLRSGVRAQNYSTMSVHTRRAFEQLGLDVRMASKFSATVPAPSPSRSIITSITLTVPLNYISNSNQVTYAYDSTNQWLYMVPGNGSAYVVPGSGTVPAGQQILIRNVTSLTFVRYDKDGVVIPASTTSDATARRVLCSINVGQSPAGVAATTEAIPSAAFAMRNISL